MRALSERMIGEFGQQVAFGISEPDRQRLDDPQMAKDVFSLSRRGFQRPRIRDPRLRAVEPKRLGCFPNGRFRQWIVGRGERFEHPAQHELPIPWEARRVQE